MPPVAVLVSRQFGRFSREDLDDRKDHLSSIRERLEVFHVLGT